MYSNIERLYHNSKINLRTKNRFSLVSRIDDTQDIYHYLLK